MSELEELFNLLRSDADASKTLTLAARKSFPLCHLCCLSQGRHLATTTCTPFKFSLALSLVDIGIENGEGKEGEGEEGG
jgi:hypothetical protein